VNFLKTITHGDNGARLVPLPPVAERPNPHTVASLARWQLVIPKVHACWDRYVLQCVSLAAFPDVPPAHKMFPEATHEFIAHAIDPRFPAESWDNGGVGLLGPVNHVLQARGLSDEQALAGAEFLARYFVEIAPVLIEPVGIRNGRATVRDALATFLRESGCWEMPWAEQADVVAAGVD